MKKKDMVAVGAIVVFACLLLCTSVSAQGNPGAGCPSETKICDTIHGGIYFEQQGWLLRKSMTKTFDNVPEGIELARIYTGFWQGSPGKGGKFNITISNATGSYATPTYQACDPCLGAPCKDYQSDRCDALNWSGNVPPNVPSGDIHDYIVGCGVHFVSFDATPYVTPGSNTITVRTSCDNCTCWDGRIYVIALLVVYENSSMPEITYWINEGAPYIEKGSNCDGPDDHLDASFYFNGTHVSNPTRAKLWTFGWPHVINATEPPAYTKLNENNIGYPDHSESYAGGNNEVLLRWDDIPTGYLDASSNLLEYHDPAPLYERAFAAVLVVEGPEIFDTGSPANPYPSIFGTHNGTITPNYDITVSRMYTYPCTGTGGHSEYIRIYNGSGTIAEASWNGYVENWHDITFTESFTLEEDKIYNYTIRTGSYPQIIHAKEEFNATGGKITCSEFIDANGKIYNDWIPAIKLYQEKK